MENLKMPHGENTCITSELKHNEKTFKLLSKVQYNTFCMTQKLAGYVFAAVLIYFGAMGGFSTVTSIVLIFLGCWAAVSGNVPHEWKAERLIKMVKGKFPHTKYEFNCDQIVLKSPKETWSLKYSEILAIIEDSDYFYLFINRKAGYMVSKEALDPGYIDEFRKIIAKRADLKVEKPGSLLRVSLPAIWKRQVREYKLKNARKGKLKK